MNRFTAQRLQDICDKSGFLVSEDTTEQEIRDYFTVDNFMTMFGPPEEGEYDQEELTNDAEYIIMYDPQMIAARHA